MVFPNRQPLHQRLALADQSLIKKVGDIRQCWIDVAKKFNIDPSDAKAFYVLDVMSRDVRAANAVLREMGHRGFTSACALLIGGRSSKNWLGGC